ncbi:MAG: cob(I)yrinic acid a,c-diamide adenosyltransferase [Flavobacteriia bacterium]|nr:cob(I)yrinic acid a,c-diamide adenosyltransferase [Flavobacteriia bacterium]
MKIYTKKGDKGSTQIIGGTRVAKHHVKIEAYGTVDELNAYVGLIRDLISNEKYIEEIVEIQDRLFTIGSLLAEDKKHSNMKLPPLNESDIEYLEKSIDCMELELEPMKSFVLPGGNSIVSTIHIGRTVCRRAERKVSLLNEVETVDKRILAYLNRLSDYLFVLSRKITKELKVKETPWQPKFD